MQKDYYCILGVAHNASQDQIEIAYAERVRELHPADIDQDRMAFIEMQKAYTFLHDPLRRAFHDRFRGSLQGLGPVKPLPSRKSASSAEEISLSRSFETYLPSYEELFDRFGRNFTDLTPPKGEKIESLNLEVILSPEEALRGGRVNVTMPARISCPLCEGKGEVGPFGCWRCERQGSIIREIPIQISYPAGISHHVTEVSLSPYGIHNFYLTVFFRAGEME